MYSDPLSKKNMSNYIAAGVMFVILFGFIILMATGVGRGGNDNDSLKDSIPNVESIENVNSIGDNFSSGDGYK